MVERSLMIGEDIRSKQVIIESYTQKINMRTNKLAKKYKDKYTSYLH